MAVNNKTLTEREITKYWENFTGLESDFESEFSEGHRQFNDPTFVPDPDNDIKEYSKINVSLYLNYLVSTFSSIYVYTSGL